MTPVRAVIFDMFETLVTHTCTPRFFGQQIAAMAQVPADSFLPLWNATDEARTLGQATLEDVLRDILPRLGRQDEALVQAIARKRRQVKQTVLAHPDPDVPRMLEALKARGVAVGLVSNCYFEEAAVIRESALFPFFNAVCLSCEEGVRKPDAAIFRLCLTRLGIPAESCLYVGDGGSEELEAASALGMRACQAAWYLPRTAWRAAFHPLARPMDVVNQL